MLFELFPTPVWVNDVDPQTQARIDLEIESALKDLSIDQRPWDDATRSTFSFEGCNHIVTMGFTELHTWIGLNLSAYLQVIEYPGSLELQDSWINSSGTGEFMFDHCHPGRSVSGCYYYRAESDQGALRFDNPNPLVHQRLWPADLNSNLSAWAVTPKTGRLCLFPSWLRHRVGVNQSQTERISIAFNFS